MLQNDHLLAKIGFDTAENEPRKEGCVVAMQSSSAGNVRATCNLGTIRKVGRAGEAPHWPVAPLAARPAASDASSDVRSEPVAEGAAQPPDVRLITVQP